MGGLTLLWAIGALVGLVRIAVGWTRLAALVRSARALDPLSPRSDARACPGGARRRRATSSRHFARGSCARRGRPVASVGSSCPRDWPSRSRATRYATSWFTNAPMSSGSTHGSDCCSVWRACSFWPHPLVHYASGQLTRAREEVCDNHVLQCGDAAVTPAPCWP